MIENELETERNRVSSENKAAAALEKLWAKSEEQQGQDNTKEQGEKEKMEEGEVEEEDKMDES